MTAYYNEIDPKTAAWLRELIKQGLIAKGDVDERSIEDVTPNDLCGYTQCHFFAGIGVWSYALRQAGWPDDRPVWTGSCPCQPFSAAGKGKGFDDERHLWPSFHWLIQQCRPDIVFGEQVAGKPGETWLDLVSTDLENEGYTFGAAVTAACGFGAPHQRKRLYWVADSKGERLERHQDTRGYGEGDQAQGRSRGRGAGCEPRIMADTASSRRQYEPGEKPAEVQHETCENTGERLHLSMYSTSPRTMADTQHDERQGRIQGLGSDSEAQGGGASTEPTGYRSTHRMGYPNSEGLEGLGWNGDGSRQPGRDKAGALGSVGPTGSASDPGPVNGFWRDADWLFCRDEKWRSVEPGTFPLVDGAANRVVKLCGYGNAIVAQQAQAFIEAAQQSMIHTL